MHVGQFFNFLSSADIFQNKLFQKFLHEHYQSVKQFGSRSGSNCSQSLSADDKIRRWQAKRPRVFY